MKYENPYIATLDEVKITRDGDTAIIEYNKKNVYSVNFKIGKKISVMSDQDILDLHNDGIKATLESAKNYEYTAIEIPHNKPQLQYFKADGSWIMRGDVLRCHIGCGDSASMATILVDDKELTMAEFGRLLSPFEGFGMRLVMVPEDKVNVMPPIKIKDPDDADSIPSLALCDALSSKREH